MWRTIPRPAWLAVAGAGIIWPFMHPARSPTAATSAAAVLAPTPLIRAMRRQASLALKTVWVLASKIAMRRARVLRQCAMDEIGR